MVVGRVQIALAAGAFFLLFVMLAVTEGLRVATRGWTSPSLQWTPSRSTTSLHPGSSIFSKGIMHREKPERSRMYPIFIHLPKTGGTAVEDTMKVEYGLRVGRFAFEERAWTREGVNKEEEDARYRTKNATCTPWHRPPAAFVHESFAVVRNPYSRIVSEFCYSPRFHNRTVKMRATPLHSEYLRIFGKIRFNDAMQGDEAETRKKTCDLWNSYFLPALREAAKAAREGYLFTLYDCHLLPQWTYLSAAEWIIEQGSLGEQLHELLALYGLQRIEVAEEKKKETERTNQSSEKCTKYAFECLTDEAAALIEEVDKQTFEYFGYSRDWKSLKS